MLSDGASFRVVATPEVETSPEAVVSLAENFGLTQPYPTRIYEELYKPGHYSGQELSGSATGIPVRFSLIPSCQSRVLGYQTAREQRQTLARLQTDQPELHLRVPSALDAVTYWYALRAGGDELSDSGAFDRTYIRHFDLEPQAVDGYSEVPDSYVYFGGEPNLGGSFVEDDYQARLVVG